MMMKMINIPIMTSFFNIPSPYRKKSIKLGWMILAAVASVVS